MTKRTPPTHYRTAARNGRVIVACMKDSGDLDKIVSDPAKVSCKQCLYRMENPK